MIEIRYRPIGIIRSPFRDVQGMPIQAVGAKGVRGTVEVEPEYKNGLKDLEGFSHLILVYHFHLSSGYELTVKPFMDDQVHGVFATRAPRRPNPIGTSVVRLMAVQGCRLNIQDVDIVDGTPLLDIKPFVPAFDVREADRIGWLSNREASVANIKSDRRFTTR